MESFNPESPDIGRGRDGKCICRGPSRRDFLKVGFLGGLGLTLGDYFQLQEAQAEEAGSGWLGERQQQRRWQRQRVLTSAPLSSLRAGGTAPQMRRLLVSTGSVPAPAASCDCWMFVLPLPKSS